MKVTEKLIINIAIELLDQALVRTASIMFEEHQPGFAFGAENTVGALARLVEAKLSHQGLPGNSSMDLAQITLQKTSMEQVKVFC